MATDYSDLKNIILESIRGDEQLKSSLAALNNLIQTKKATYLSAADFSKVLGGRVGALIQANIPNGIPNEDLLAFAESCLKPIYESMQISTIDICKEVQRLQNELSGINLNPVNVKADKSMIENAVEKFAEAETFEEVKFLTNENTAKSIARDVVNESIKQNLQIQSDAGFQTLIRRTDNGGCCAWCKTVVGTYRSVDELPRGFWAVHNACTCTIDYRVGKTRDKISFTTENGRMRKNTINL